MHKTIVKNWNDVVGVDDIVWILGDLSLCGGQQKQNVGQIINRLNGVKHLVYGNHDKLHPLDYIEMGFQTVHYPIFQLPNGWYLGHDPVLAELLPEKSIYLCGHVHGLFRTLLTEKQTFLVNVGIDVSYFSPFSYEDIKRIISEEKLQR